MCTELLLTDRAVWTRGTGRVGAAILDGNLEKGDRALLLLMAIAWRTSADAGHPHPKFTFATPPVGHPQGCVNTCASNNIK